MTAYFRWKSRLASLTLPSAMPTVKPKANWTRATFALEVVTVSPLPSVRHCRVHSFLACVNEKVQMADETQKTQSTLEELGITVSKEVAPLFDALTETLDAELAEAP